jgi:hypothetical protein
MGLYGDYMALLPVDWLLFRLLISFAECEYYPFVNADTTQSCCKTFVNLPFVCDAFTSHAHDLTRVVFCACTRASSSRNAK